MGHTVAKGYAYLVLCEHFRQVSSETIDALIRSGELTVHRVGTVDRVSWEDLCRVIDSWESQQERHK